MKLTIVLTVASLGTLLEPALARPQQDSSPYDSISKLPRLSRRYHHRAAMSDKLVLQPRAAMRGSHGKKITQASNLARQSLGNIKEEIPKVPNLGKQSPDSFKDKISSVSDLAKQSSGSIKDEITQVSDLAKQSSGSKKGEQQQQQHKEHETKSNRREYKRKTKDDDRVLSRKHGNRPHGEDFFPFHMPKVDGGVEECDTNLRTAYHGFTREWTEEFSADVMVKFLKAHERYRRTVPSGCEAYRHYQILVQQKFYKDLEEIESGRLDYHEKKDEQDRIEAERRNDGIRRQKILHGLKTAVGLKPKKSAEEAYDSKMERRRKKAESQQ